MTWHFPWQSRAETDRDTWAARYAELQRHVETLTAHLGEAHRTIEQERAMGAMAERVAEGYRVDRDEALDDITVLVERDQEDDRSRVEQSDQIVALTAVRDVLWANLTTAQSERDTWQARYTELHATVATQTAEIARLTEALRPYRRVKGEILRKAADGAVRDVGA